MSETYDKICYLYRRWFKKKLVEKPPQDVKNWFDELLLPKNETRLSQNDLKEFLKINQGEEDTSASEIAKKAVSKSFKRSRTFNKKGLNLDDFLHFLLSNQNPPLPKQMQEDDLNHTLPHYFVNTSHYSYLKQQKSMQAHNLIFMLSDVASKNPITSNEDDYKISSSISAIVKALKSGVRVIELNLHPNFNSTNVQVQHEGAPHSSVTLGKCLKAIRQNAFDKSEFPVILVLVEHINSNLQAVVGAKIEKYFGTMVCSSDDAFNLTLQSLKNKFIILSRQQKGEEMEPDRSEVESPENYQKLIAGHIEDLDDQFMNLQDGEARKVRILRSTDSLLENAKSPKNADIIRFTQKNLLAVYPSPSQQDEEITPSDYDPFLGWTHGAQMVAFNMQPKQKSDDHQSDKFLWIMQGLFRAYGDIGYVRKPDILLDKNKIFDPKVWRPVKKILKVKVYMGTGWHLDFGEHEFDETSPDFFVALEIVGHPEDEAREKTVPAIDQWIPTWNQEFEFPLTVPELAMLMIEVKEFDADRTHDFGGQTCLPVWLLRDGIRSVPLYKKNGKPCKAARLLIRFKEN